MDWSKSKSIFIVVFLILDVFLLSLYLNRHTEAQRMENTLLAERTIEAKLKDDNITYNNLPTTIEKAPYISGKVKNFEEEDIDIPNVQTNADKNKLLATLVDPVAIDIEDPNSVNDFLKSNVYEGASYVLWEVDAENKRAIFFQTAIGSVIYYNNSGTLTIYWNDDQEVFKYEQTLLEDINTTVSEEQRGLSAPLRAIQTLYNKGLLLSNSTVLEVNLGYSTLLPENETHVFVPTWEVRVKTPDDEEEVYFVNAVQGGVVDLKTDGKRVKEAVEEATIDDNEGNE